MEKKKNKFNGFDITKDNNSQDPYGYDFVPELSHWTNIDEQRKEVKHLENINKCSKKTNNSEKTTYN